MKITLISKTKPYYQDGAIWGGYFFRFDAKGNGIVYKMSDVKTNKDPQPISEFVLDRADALTPHNNAVMFGTQFYEDGDEFPLLYTNIYNNYANSPCKLNGVCLVYRLQKNGNEFKSTLVQVIEVGFAYERGLWLSDGDIADVRPYGNFTIDRDKNILYAFTMRDGDKTTRYFSFKLPSASDGEMYPINGVKRVVLTKDDICDYFDCEYHNYIQGACFSDGKIYSVEGFTNSIDAPAAIRVIDVNLKKQISCKTFKDYGINQEPELIEIADGICYYSDLNGNVYKLSFEN